MSDGSTVVASLMACFTLIYVSTVAYGGFLESLKSRERIQTMILEALKIQAQAQTVAHGRLQ